MAQILATAARVSIKVFDINSNLISVVFEGSLDSGSYEIKRIETTAYKKSIIKIELKDRIAEMLIVKIKTNSAEYSEKVVYMNK